MTTDEYLSQLYRIEYKIKYLAQKANEFEEMATSIGGNAITERVQTSKKYDKMGDAVSKAVDFKIKAEKEQKGIIELKDKIERQLESLSVFDYTIILKEYYINGLHIDEISGLLDVSIATVCRKKKAALEEFESKYLSTYANKRPI